MNTYYVLSCGQNLPSASLAFSEGAGKQTLDSLCYCPFLERGNSKFGPSLEVCQRSHGGVMLSRTSEQQLARLAKAQRQVNSHLFSFGFSRQGFSV